ncbi:MAG: 5'-nucleotidase [Myxococcota bacterium]
MPLDFSQTLVVGISSTALFDLHEAVEVFTTKGIKAYREYMVDREDVPLEPGTGMPLVRSLLSLNTHCDANDMPIAEVVVMSLNSPETGARIAKTIRALGLPISRFAFTGGEALADYVEGYCVDLFLSTNEADVQAVVDAGKCAGALLYDPPEGFEPPENQVRIAFDADAVLFNEESEVVYQKEGLPAFHANEDTQQDAILPDGSHANLLRKLSRLQERLPQPVEYSPVRLAIVTARNAPAEMRVIKTLRAWGVYVDAIFFLGGLEKGPILKALRPHIFFDDQDRHLAVAATLVPSGRVPYKKGSGLNPVDELVERLDTSEVPLSRSPADDPSPTDPSHATEYIPEGVLEGVVRSVNKDATVLGFGPASLEKE